MYGAVHKSCYGKLILYVTEQSVRYLNFRSNIKGTTKNETKFQSVLSSRGVSIDVFNEQQVNARVKSATYPWFLLICSVHTNLK